MSGENIELHRRLFAEFNARDLEAFMAYCDPAIEFHSTFADVGGGVYHGHDGLRSWHRDFAETCGEIRLDPEAYFDFGEHTLAFYVAKGRGRQSGVEVAQSAAHVAKWRAGLCVHARPTSIGRMRSRSWGSQRPRSSPSPREVAAARSKPKTVRSDVPWRRPRATLHRAS